jgi:hypothetical protein
MTTEQFTMDRAAAAELRGVTAGLQNPFPMWAMATTPKDITSRSYQMPRESWILYRNRDPRGADPAHYRGIMRDSDGRVFWITLWVRQVKGERALEIRRVPKTS